MNIRSTCIIGIMCLLFLIQCVDPPGLHAENKAKTVIIDTIGFSLLGGGLGLAYSYTIGDIPDDDDEKNTYIGDNVKKGLLYGAIVGAVIGAFDVLDVFNNPKPTDTVPSLLNISGQDIKWSIPGFTAGPHIHQDSKTGFCFAVNMVSLDI